MFCSSLTRSATLGTGSLLLNWFLSAFYTTGISREQSSVIRSSLAYIVVSSSRRRDHEEEEEEEEELDLRLRKLSIEEEEEEEEEDEDEESSINLSRQESTGSSIQLNRQESTTESESSVRSANSLSPGTEQVFEAFIKKQNRRNATIAGTAVEHVSTADAGSTPPAAQVEICHKIQSLCKFAKAKVEICHKNQSR